MTIAQVSQKYGLSADTLRYYERVGLIPTVTRGKGGIRDYGEEDCRWVEFIKCLQSAGLPIEVLIAYVALFIKGDSTVEARRELLSEQRRALAARIEEMRQTLERLDQKIENYESVTRAREKALHKAQSGIPEQGDPEQLEP